MMKWFLPRLLAVAVLCAWTLVGCRGDDGRRNAFRTTPGERLERKGDEIVVCGQLFHTGAPVVLWTDPGGYDAYRVERRFVDYERSSWQATTREAATRPSVNLSAPVRYGLRESVLSFDEREQVRGGGWDLPLLQEKVDQFVYHYDVAGTARQCFRVLHDMRGLSVHFMLDIDGTIYQTLDLKERAWHAGKANSRSIGIEIANMGAYAIGETDAALRQWYGKDERGRTRITVPERLGDGGVRTPNFVGYPARNDLVFGEVQGKVRRQYDLTPQQYESLIKLTATLATVFPKIRLDYPRDENGKLITHVLNDEQYEQFEGLVGHYHVSDNKSDPGPAFQWDYVVEEAGKMVGRKMGE